MPSEVEIGVWVEGLQKWVTGVTRRTTCHDVIKALLRAQNVEESSFDINDYVIVERWRKMERPLDHEQRILKVWKTWGESVQEVRFTLRRLADDEDKMSLESGSRLERSRRRHKLRQISSKGAPVNKKPPTKDQEGISGTMDRLMRLVVAQGETIQTQLRRMHERDHQIESFEHQIHELRVQSMGSNYLLHSYLRETLQENDPEKNFYGKDDTTCEEHSNDSGVVAEEMLDEDKKAPFESEMDVNELETRTYILTKIESVLHTLLEYEEKLSNLQVSLTESTAGESSEIKEEINNECKIHASTVNQVRQNDQQLRELDTLLYQKRMTLDKLLEEEIKYEREVITLQAHLDHIIHLPPTAFLDKPPRDILNYSSDNIKVKDESVKKPFRLLPPAPSCSPPPLDEERDSCKTDSGANSSSSIDSNSGTTSSNTNSSARFVLERTKENPVKKSKCIVSPSLPKDSDSNSDTGLSSLHSSSDEGVYVLDTLV